MLESYREFAILDGLRRRGKLALRGVRHAAGIVMGTPPGYGAGRTAYEVVSRTHPRTEGPTYPEPE